MINDKLLPVIRAGSRENMPELKPGQLALLEGEAVDFDELYAGTSRGNSLINPRALVKTKDEPDHVDGLAWIEVGNNGKPKYDFAWVSRDGKWVSEQLYEAKLNATSQADMSTTELIDLPYFGLNGLEPSIFVEEMRVTLISEVEDEAPMGHNRIRVALGGLNPFDDENAIVKTEQGSKLSGKSFRRSFDMAEVVAIDSHPVFGLDVRAAGGVTAFSSALGSMAYRLVRELPEVSEEPAENTTEETAEQTTEETAD